MTNLTGVPTGNARARPLCPALQPKEPEPLVPWLGCNNVLSTLLAVTAGGGTNAVFDYTLFREEKERKCDPVNCQPETMAITVWLSTDILNETLWNEVATPLQHRLCTPELRWHPRGKRRILQGFGQMLDVSNDGTQAAHIHSYVPLCETTNLDTCANVVMDGVDAAARTTQVR